MQSSFKPFSGQFHGPTGVKLNRQYQISTGIHSLDDVLGGGIFLGTITMIKQDRWSDYASLILKYFISQGAVCGHQGIIISLDADPTTLKNGLMGLSKSSKIKSNAGDVISRDIKPMTRQLGGLRNDQMKIAWRYQNLDTVSADLNRNAPVDESYCSTFDLTTKLDESLHKDLLKTVDESDLSQNQGDNDSGIFSNLLKMIKSELKSLESIPKNSPKSILRIAIDSFASALWPDINQSVDSNGNQRMSCIHFLYALKSILRSYNAAVLLTVPAYLYNDFIHVSSNPLIRKMEYACDAVMEIESFSGSPRETNPLYTSDYTGLVHPIRLSRFHSVTPNTRLSPLDLKSLGFKVQRKKFSIETFHLPPEDQIQGSETNCSEHLMKFFKKLFKKSSSKGSELDDILTKKYSVGAVLGTGSFAVVKIVKRKSDNVDLACKIIDRQKFKKNEKLFRSEIQVLQKVSHQHICVLRELIETSNYFYLISDLAAGGELFTALLNKGHFYEKDAARITKQILLALDYLHKEGIVHRDLKPENILLKSTADDSDIMITDFGLARFSEKNDLLTTTCGTPYYVAPEVLQQTGYSFPCDLWSVGVLTYVLLSGTLPFASSEDDVSNFILFSVIKKGKFSFPSDYWDHISLEAKNFIESLLVVNPDLRLTTGGALDHPWMSTSSEFDVLPNVRKNFDAKKTFKKAIQAVRGAMNFENMSK